MDILDIKNLNLFFRSGEKRFQALYDVNIQLEKGKMLALVGESGCGKTVTAMSVLRLLSQNAEISSGEILYKGKDLLKLSTGDMQKIRGKEIALIPQDPMTSLNPLYTIGNQLKEVISLHQGLYGKEADKTAIEALEAVKIPNAKERLKSYPHEFSGGMRQRVIIAAAVACKAEIIIADEPTTALDVTVQAQIMQLLKELQNENNTSFIFISHDFGLVKEVADSVAVMYAGHVVETSPDTEIFDNPKHPYTSALINSLPDMDSKILVPVPGQPPSVKDNFPGCPFYPRCDKKIKICNSVFPRVFTDNSRSVSCYLYN